MTPPNVDGAPNPTSSVRISTMFGAPFGGTTRAGHAGFDWAALRLIWPSNFCGGGGMYRPSIVVVASGEPVTPVVCWADAGVTANATRQTITAMKLQTVDLIDVMVPLHSIEGISPQVESGF